MIDRFKFRGWDKPSYDFPQGCMTYFNIHKGIGDCNIIMQCIDKRDKNNKLIFEGDLLKYKSCTQEYLLLVGYDKDDLQFKFLSEGNNSYPSVLKSDKVKSSIAVVASFEMSECEVIGNIYENPKLLKI
tara:strand:- start:304 stop:690 length:387 start_codon:yes stop_codon:yes gene_type:complete